MSAFGGKADMPTALPCHELQRDQGLAGIHSYCFRGEKVLHLVKETAPNGVTLQNHVIAAFECDEARAADTRCDPTPFIKRLQSIVTAMEHKGRGGHAWGEIGQVYLVKRATQPCGVVGGCCDALQIIE